MVLISNLKFRISNLELKISQVQSRLIANAWAEKVQAHGVLDDIHDYVQIVKIESMRSKARQTMQSR